MRLVAFQLMLLVFDANPTQESSRRLLLPERAFALIISRDPRSHRLCLLQLCLQIGWNSPLTAAGDQRRSRGRKVVLSLATQSPCCSECLSNPISPQQGLCVARLRTT